MTEASMLEDPLARAAARMRRVDEPEAPFTGWLARQDDTALHGAVVHLVDTRALRGWPGWHARGPHVLSVLDVARTSDGHEAILPWCVERVETFLARRAAGGADLSAGEVVTLVVSLLRGCGTARGTALHGAWWLTHDGTPTFVCDTDRVGDSIGDATGSLLDVLAQSRNVDGNWRLAQIATIVRGDAHETSTRWTDVDQADADHAGADHADAEAHLFAIAPPEPLVLAPLMPKRASAARRPGSLEIVEPERGDTVLGRLLRRHVDAGVGGMVSDALDAARRRVGRVRTRFARPWLVAAGIAGVIVVGGLAWPTSTAPPANARPVASDSAVSSDAVSSEAGAPQDAAADATPVAGAAPEADAAQNDAGAENTQNDPVGALHAALDRLAACTDDACGTELFEDPTASQMPPGAVDLPAAERSVSLLDDLGGVAILSVTGLDETIPAQLVVLVRIGEQWLIRDVRDVEAP